MILRLTLKTLLQHPVRAVVLGVGFGLGVGVMATLLGVGEVVLEQAREPALAGGGDFMATGAADAVTSARFVLWNLAAQRAGVASPRKRADLFLMRPGRDPIPIRARGGIPSLERALGDPETSSVSAWTDAPGDAAWSSPTAEEVLRAMDRFHPIPDVPARASSWAEWLYFKGSNFYCTFLVGPRRDNGRRIAGVRLQLDRDGQVTSHGESAEIQDAALLASAPDLAIGNSRVRLEGLRYHVMLNLPGASGDFYVDAVPGRQLAPLVIRGAGGWVSGYTVPVMSGPVTGYIDVAGTTKARGKGRSERIALSGSGYHDHNWGFWEGVTWRWGQVQHEGLSYVYGRVFPPEDAADPERIPGFLVALGADGPVGYSTHVTISETDEPSTHQPRRIVVSGRGASLDLTMDIAVDNAIVSPGGALAGGPDFLQLRARYRVTGTAGGQRVDFAAPGAAETFRGRR